MGEPVEPASDELLAEFKFNASTGRGWRITAEQAAAVLARLSAAEAELAPLRAGFGPEQADEFTEAINAAHPVASGNHEHMALAERLVHVRQSKWSLVRLVNWLLCQRADAEADARRLQEDKDDLAALMGRIARKLRTAGGHQHWCRIYGEMLGWDDSKIAALEPFMLKYFSSVAEAIERETLAAVESAREETMSALDRAHGNTLDPEFLARAKVELRATGRAHIASAIGLLEKHYATSFGE